MWRWIISMNFLLFFVIVVPRSSVQYHDGYAGPWYKPTEGDVWPAPNNREIKQYYYYIRLGNFVIRTNGNTCDIIEDAIARYTAIIQNNFRHLKNVEHISQVPNSDPNYKGTLSALEVHLLQPCENSEYWPHLNMDERYTLEVSEISDVAVLSSNSPWGILRGIETFSQIVTIMNDSTTHLKVICQKITDFPLFSHRGLLVDTSRHFIPVSDILLILDAMSYNKMNVFHWHIVDDNSFPYESEKYKLLSAAGAYSQSMTYSSTAINAILNYARLRGIRVIPEFDTPGHTASWGLGYPWLLTKCYDKNGVELNKAGPIDPTNPEVIEFLRNLFTEVFGVFKDKFFHLGSEETALNCWNNNPKIIEYMKAHGISSATQLETKYVRGLIDIINKLNGTAIVWQAWQQPQFTNASLDNKTVVQVWTKGWQDLVNEFTKMHRYTLLSTCWYLDHFSGDGDWQKFYNCNPLASISTKEQKEYLLGGEACMWSEFVDETNIHPRIWPRATAAAERLWSKNAVSVDVAARRLEEHTCRMRRRGIKAQPPNGASFCPY